MNCQEISFLLDAYAPETLTSAQRATIDAHFASCEACREDWNNWRSVAALPIPVTPRELGPRIAALTHAQSARSALPLRRPRQAFTIGSLLIAGAAIAALALRFGPESPDSDGRVESAPESVVEETLPPANIAPDVRGDGSAEPSAAELVAPGMPPRGLDPLSIAVFARPEAVAGPDDLAEFVKCYDAIVRQLESIQGLNVIAGLRVSSFDGGALSDPEIAGQLGAGSLLVVSSELGCNARHHDSQTNAQISGRTNGAGMPPPNGWEPFATGVALRVRDALLKNPESLINEALARLLDTTIGDRERISALNDLPSGAYDSAVVAALVQLGQMSPDAGVRSAAWTNLRIAKVDDPYLVQPLLQVLANDSDADVRMQVAFTLNTFLDEPGVREALLHAAAVDPSSEPEFTCCIWTVREAAEWASVATEDLPARARARLLDESLTVRSRLYWISAGSPDGRSMRVGDLGGDVPATVFSMGRNEADPGVRAMAWRVLDARSLEPDAVSVLIEDLRNHPGEYVRSAAATALSWRIDDPVVRSAFEQALNDPSTSVRRVVSGTLNRR